MIVTQKDKTYIKVPSEFALIFWGSTDLAITHGDPYMVIGNYPGSIDYYRKKIGKSKGKKKFVGEAIPYKDKKTGRKIVGLFDRVDHLEKPEEKDVLSCLKKLKKILKKSRTKKSSMHACGLGMETTELLVSEVFEGTPLNILIRAY